MRFLPVFFPVFICQIAGYLPRKNGKTSSEEIPKSDPGKIWPGSKGTNFFWSWGILGWRMCLSFVEVCQGGAPDCFLEVGAEEGLVREVEHVAYLLDGVLPAFQECFGFENDVVAYPVAGVPPADSVYDL